jgi:hypothetical protein
MDALLGRCRALLDQAVVATGPRGFWTPFPRVPSGERSGETARENRLAALAARTGRPFARPDYPESHRIVAEA